MVCNDFKYVVFFIGCLLKKGGIEWSIDIFIIKYKLVYLFDLCYLYYYLKIILVFYR